MDQLTPARAKKEVLDFLEETFDKHHGVYIDKGTTFFETLDSTTAEEASYRATDKNASLAAHVRHVIFYLGVTEQAILGTLQDEKINWREIWENDRPVSTEQWEVIIAELRQKYSGIRQFLEDPKTWELEDALGGSIAMIAHTAYHLGAVRQALALMRARQVARS
jgi:hypothetical protein